MTAAKGSPSGRAGAQAPERARLLTETPKHSDNTALSKALLIAVQQLFGNGLALSVTFGDTSPKGRGLGYSVRLQPLTSRFAIAYYKQ